MADSFTTHGLVPGSSTLAILGPEMSLVEKRKECTGWGVSSGRVCHSFVALTVISIIAHNQTNPS